MPTPQICLPITLATEVTITVTFDGAGVRTATIPAGTTRYNDRSGNTSTDWMAYIASRLSLSVGSGGTGFTWTSGEVAGLPYGRAYLQTQSTDFVTAIDLSDPALSAIMGQDGETPGITVTTAGPVKTSYIPGPYVRKGLWIPHGDLAVSSPLLDDEVYTRRVMIETRAPDGSGDLQDWGAATFRDIEIGPIWAASGKSAWLADGAYAEQINSSSTSDPHLPLDKFLELWATTTGSKTARFSRDFTAPTLYYNLEPRAEFFDTSRVLELFSRAPRRYRVLFLGAIQS